MSGIQMSRRHLLVGLAGAATSAGLLAGCSPSGTEVGSPASPTTGGAGGGSVMPTYIPWTGVSYDLPGVPGRSTPGSMSFPEPVQMFTDKPGDGKAFKVWSFVHENPPGLGQNKFWQALNEQLGSPFESILSLTPDYATKFPTLLASGTLPDMFPLSDQGGVNPSKQHRR